MDALKAPLPAAEVAPHRGRMLLLRNVIAHAAGGTACDVEIRPDNLFFREGGVPAWVSVELMAQTVAAHSGMTGRASGKGPEIGFLIGVRRAAFHVPSFREGALLHVEVSPVWGEDELYSFSGLVRDAATGDVVAEAQLNLFKPRNLKEFLGGKER